MFRPRIRKIARSIGSLIVLLILAIPALNATAPNVTYTASGTFSSPPVSGSDTLRLAGEPFVITIVASAASVPIKNGPNWAVYSPLRMTGEVHSGLVGPTPVAIASDGASIELLWGPPYDLFVTGFPVKVVGIDLTINATLTLPTGTLINQLIHPFAPVALDVSNSVVNYSDGTDTTTLNISSGTIQGTIPTSSSTLRPAKDAPAGRHASLPYAGSANALIPSRRLYPA